MKRNSSVAYRGGHDITCPLLNYSMRSSPLPLITENSTLTWTLETLENGNYHPCISSVLIGLCPDYYEYNSTSPFFGNDKLSRFELDYQERFAKDVLDPLKAFGGLDMYICFFTPYNLLPNDMYFDLKQMCIDNDIIFDSIELTKNLYSPDISNNVYFACRYSNSYKPNNVCLDQIFRLYELDQNDLLRRSLLRNLPEKSNYLAFGLK